MSETLKTCSCAQCRKRAAAASEITNKIKPELAKHAQYEGKVVAAIFSTAPLLLQLHGLGLDIWKEQLKVLGLNSRLASDYLYLARSELAKSDLREADLIRLPSDLGKLKLIGQLFPKDLEALFKSVDPRTASHRQVDAAVLAIWEHYVFSRVPEGERNRVQ
jgi:hypothetical protein